MSIKNTSALIATLPAVINDNDSGDISAANVRQVLTDGYESAFNRIDNPEVGKGTNEGYFFINIDAYRIRVNGSTGAFEFSNDSGITWSKARKNITGSVSTTDDTETTILTYPTTIDSVHNLRVKIAAKRTGGTSGTLGDVGFFTGVATIKNVGDVVTIQDSEIDLGIPDQIWVIAFDIDTTDILVTVTGTVDNDIDWVITDAEIDIF